MYSQKQKESPKNPDLRKWLIKKEKFTQVFCDDLLDFLVPVRQPPPDDLLSLSDGHALDVDLVGDELVGRPPDLLVDVQSPFHYVRQSQPVRADHPHNHSPAAGNSKFIKSLREKIPEIKNSLFIHFC